MNQIYCGKNCDECPEREALGCPGCRSGPGRSFSGDCPIAACCRESHFRDCAECPQEESCALWKCRGGLPAIRLREQEEARVRQVRTYKKIIPRLILLCVMLALQFIVTACGRDGLDVYPLSSYETHLDTAIQVVCGVTLLSMWQASPRFRKAGLFSLISVVLNLLEGVFSNVWLRLLVVVPLAVFSLMALYQELYGYAGLTEACDPKLSERWRRLWRWFLWLILIDFALPFLALWLFRDMTFVYLTAMLLAAVSVFFVLWRMGLLTGTIRSLKGLEEPQASAVPPAEEAEPAGA